jgi:hypothetical protein
MVQELMCGHRERLGDLEQAEATFRAAESLDSSWPLTLMSLARYASHRGDAERGLSLLRRAGATTEHELVVLLERFQPAPRPGLGRNHPCWCGSGRKYKVCHLHREQLPLAERAAWLYQKAGAGLLEGPFGPLLIETAQARARYCDSPDALERAIEDGLACDAVLFEGGAIARRSRISQGRTVIGRRRLRRAALHERRPTRGFGVAYLGWPAHSRTGRGVWALCDEH